MEPVGVVRGRVSALLRDDVDTDQIMPKQHLKRVERTGYGQFLFDDWFRDEPGFTLERAPILVAGRNFGCGSSREHAAWGIQDFGFRAVVAESFSDIFASNAMKIGLLPVALPRDAVEAVAAAGEAEVDLAAQEVRAGGRAWRFDIDPERRERLLGGLDDIALTLQQEEAIAAYERDRERTGPVTTAL